MSQFDTAVLRLVLTFGVMGVWVMVIAFATASRGGKLGGFLIGIPSTSGLSFFFTGWLVSSATAVRATNDFPVFVSLSGLFLLCFGYLARRSFVIGVCGSLSAWFAASLLVVYSGLDDFGISLLGSLVISAVTYCIFRFKLKPRKTPGGIPSTSSLLLLLLRFLLGGGIVTLAVFFGQIGIPILSAMAASFPALSISALIAIRMNSKTEGTEYPRGMAMPAMVSIVLMLVPFSIAVRYLYPALGVFYGTLASYAVAAAIGLPYYYYLEGYLVPSFADQDPPHQLVGGERQSQPRDRGKCDGKRNQKDIQEPEPKSQI